MVVGPVCKGYVGRLELQVTSVHTTDPFGTQNSVEVKGSQCLIPEGLTTEANLKEELGCPRLRGRSHQSGSAQTGAQKREFARVNAKKKGART